MAIIRNIVGFVFAAAITTVLGSFIHTQMIIAGLAGAGAPIDLQTRLDMSADDLAALAPSFGAVVAIGLAIGFMIASVLKRILKPLAPIAYPLAGAAALAIALFAMHVAFGGITPVAGARTPLGFALISLAGAVGGLVFSAIKGSRQG